MLRLDVNQFSRSLGFFVDFVVDLDDPENDQILGYSKDSVKAILGLLYLGGICA